MTLFKYLSCLIFLMNSLVVFAIDSNVIEAEANQSIEALYHRLGSLPTTSMAERINWISAQFLGKDYVWGALGEGADARYDQYPRCRVDAFDCETYVTTVLSLVLANTLSAFQDCLRTIRYKDGRVSYINRNHFTSLDWNQNNQQRGFLKDITVNIKDKEKKPVASFVTTIIDKSAWYAAKSTSVIRLLDDNRVEQEKRLDELRRKGQALGKGSITLAYLPLDKLLKNNQADPYLLSQIPNGAIIEIIRPGWDLRKQIGTFLDISHLGFAIWIKGQLYFREASQLQGKVSELLLENYLREIQKSPTIKGINIQVLVPGKPLGSCIMPAFSTSLFQ